mmetsp:Transcript_12893/g.14764  ORF Transcript_12893/g.14764 Transcript_12893/m.14764 type:complete len:113 (-) Transcript_12893:466-804(-)
MSRLKKSMVLGPLEKLPFMDTKLLEACGMTENFRTNRQSNPEKLIGIQDPVNLVRDDVKFPQLKNYNPDANMYHSTLTAEKDTLISHVLDRFKMISKTDITSKTDLYRKNLK